MWPDGLVARAMAVGVGKAGLWKTMEMFQVQHMMRNPKLYGRYQTPDTMIYDFDPSWAKFGIEQRYSVPRHRVSSESGAS